MKSIYLVFIGVLGLVGHNAQAQRIQGRVFDKDTKVPIEQAKISMYKENGQVIDSVFTVFDGSYNYAPLNPGEVYKVATEARNYSSAEVLVEQSEHGALVIFGLVALGGNSKGVTQNQPNKNTNTHLSNSTSDKMVARTALTPAKKKAETQDGSTQKETINKSYHNSFTISTGDQTVAMAALTPAKKLAESTESAQSQATDSSSWNTPPIKHRQSPSSSLSSTPSQVNTSVVVEDSKYTVKQDSHQKVATTHSQPQFTSPQTKGFVGAIYYDFNSSYLNDQNKQELNAIIDGLRKDRNSKIQVNIFLDVQVADVKYQEWLVQRRRDRIINYFISKGIARSRIVAQIEVIEGWPEPLAGQKHSPRNTRRCDFVII